ncbi:hypothetical protein EYC84_005952 [Monilinia fructicola]|uniref:Uncharacterized protein n=1 Tax=Monilinia fructicola TaxID=38448 RepID=A0A5M9JY87_MONFR|nr:hypothetical protein EYC84_005952 [Monilinia fructicola]
MGDVALINGIKIEDCHFLFLRFGLLIFYLLSSTIYPSNIRILSHLNSSHLYLIDSNIRTISICLGKHPPSIFRKERKGICIVTITQEALRKKSRL